MYKISLRSILKISYHKIVEFKLPIQKHADRAL